MRPGAMTHQTLNPKESTVLIQKHPCMVNTQGVFFRVLPLARGKRTMSKFSGKTGSLRLNGKVKGLATIQSHSRIPRVLFRDARSHHHASVNFGQPFKRVLHDVVDNLLEMGF